MTTIEKSFFLMVTDDTEVLEITLKCSVITLLCYCILSHYYLVSLYKDKDIVHSNSQHQEWHNFYDNQGHWNIQVTIETNRGCHRQQHYRHTSQPKGYLRINLKILKHTVIIHTRRL